MIDSIEKATKAVPLRANLSGISRQRFPRAVAATTQSLVNEKQTAEIVDKVPRRMRGRAARHRAFPIGCRELACSRRNTRGGQVSLAEGATRTRRAAAQPLPSAFRELWKLPRDRIGMLFAAVQVNVDGQFHHYCILTPHRANGAPE